LEKRNFTMAEIACGVKEQMELLENASSLFSEAAATGKSDVIL
jgi:hypothetical protein